MRCESPILQRAVSLQAVEGMLGGGGDGEAVAAQNTCILRRE